ncbi:MAG: Gfo/Idh/MocA family oxidoreductase [Tannerella sp.]|jgi:predicted dehydrogenase|nr:Gfo/Idh/MocA family oxidoreductase [Tannerella sp.]
MSNQTTRRDFIKKSTLLAAGVSLGAGVFPASGKVLGANEKIRIGFIGVGNRGSQLLRLFMDNPDCEVAALCDVYEPYLLRNRDAVDPRYLKDLGGQIPRMGEQFPVKPALYKDWQKLIEDKSIDAVVIATPDHWHALQTIAAIKAGKDVYVEKPLTITIREGRKMVEAQAASKQVVAVGLNRRGNAVYQKLAKEIPAGKIGKVTVGRAFRVNDMFPDGIGRMSPEMPPKDFDWDSWLGPRAYRPYQYNIAPYKFRWWSDYSSQMGNWGVHFMDVIRWMMNERAPVAISAHGGKFAVNHDGDIADTMQVIYEFASGALVTFSIFEASGGGLFQQGEVELRGTKGTLTASESGYRITPNRPGQFQTWTTLMEAEELTRNDAMLADGSSGDSTATLVRNFLDCVKSRQTPLCPLEEGHRSTSFAHLGNIALATGEKLRWDPERELFTNSAKANELLHYEYRSQWKMFGL